MNIAAKNKNGMLRRICRMLCGEKHIKRRNAADDRA